MTACPTPKKGRHHSRGAAVAARTSLERTKGVDLTLEPYLCVCGKWHLGHPRPNDRRPVAKRIGLQ